MNCTFAGTTKMIVVSVICVHKLPRALDEAFLLNMYGLAGLCVESNQLIVVPHDGRVDVDEIRELRIL